MHKSHDGFDGDGFDGDGFDGDGFSSFAIEKMLTSTDPGVWRDGLYRVNTRYGGPYSGALKRVCAARGWRVQSEDIADIWQGAMNDIWVCVSQGKFEQTGHLDGYVYTIFTRRAVDFFRRSQSRCAGNREFDVDLSELVSYDDSDETPEIAFVWMLRDYIKALSDAEKLSKTESLVIEHYVTLLSAKNKVPSMDELTAFVNTELTSDRKEVLTMVAVKSAKARAIKKLRGTRDNGDQK